VRQKKFKDWSAEKMAAASNRVEQAGRATGINFKDGGKIGSTRDAHRLIYLCQKTQTPKEQDALVEKLFEAYHEQEKDISSKEVVREIAIDAGIREIEVNEWLNSDLDGKTVDEEAQYNREKVSNGVPTFIIQGVHRVDGAQDLQELLEALVKAKEGVA
jgi:predicted DsbA family dithiol-disulfide isomerase